MEYKRDNPTGINEIKNTYEKDPPINYFIENSIDPIGMMQYSKNRLKKFSPKKQINSLYNVYNSLLND